MEKQLIEIITKLVSYPTVSPVGNEYLCQKYLQKILKKLNAKVTIMAKDKKRPNVIAEWGKGSKSLVIALHMDVVEVGKAWKDNPFKVRTSKGYLIGRGVLDDKGPYAVAYLAVKKFLKDYPKFTGKLYLVALADEEADNVFGVKYLLTRKFKAAAALIPDGGSLKELDVGEKGCVQLKIFSYGKQEHSALQENGNNAIENILSVMNEIKKMTWSNKYDQSFSPTKVNFSLIKGGSFPNSIAAQCFVQMDIRYPFGFTSKYVLDKVNEVISRAKKTNPRSKYKIEIVYKTEPHKVENIKLIKQFLKAGENINLKIKPITLAGNSVGKEFTEGGIPAIVHYPSSILTPHEPEEKIKINDYLKGIELYYQFLKLYFEQE